MKEDKVEKMHSMKGECNVNSYFNQILALTLQIEGSNI